MRGRRLKALLPVLLALASSALAGAAGEPFQANYRDIVSRADLDYTTPVARGEEGMPVGNGRMGSLVWTEPSALKLQINRVDVFAENSATNSFPERDADYGSGCAYVDIDLVDFGDDVFEGAAFRQQLALYDGLMTARGRGVTARVLAWPARDVMAVEIDDQRPQPSLISADLRMLRYAVQYHSGLNYDLARTHSVMIRTRNHTATSRLEIRESRTVLIQEFREGDYYNASAVAVGVIGRPAKAKYANESTVRLSAAPGEGRFTILIASAASFDPAKDVAASALTALEAAAAKGFEALRADTSAWWHDFWSKGLVHLHSADGQADFVGQNYTYFLYLMGASSRGDFPPRFGGMLWRTTGDLSRWGAQHWWANTNAYYSNLLPANRLDLLDPMFAMYSGMYDACARAAAEQWGSQGIWIPETIWFDGPEDLPDDVAAEIRDLYLVRKPWDERSERFRRFAEVKQPHESRWNWIDKGRWENGHWVFEDKGKGAFGHTSHILGAGARIAALYWDRYQFTMDEAWLRDRAYPMIKGAAEFYRHFPNFGKDADGKYHLHHTNSGESSWNTSDTPYETACLHMIFPLAIRASEILGADADLRPIWQEIKDNLVERRGASGRGRRAYGAFVYGGPGEIEPIGPEPELKSRFLGFNRLGSFIDGAGIGGAQIFRNRLRLREGPGAIDAEHIGGLSAGIHECLLASAPETDGGEVLLRLFSDWPRSWDAAFTLLARGAFLVSAAMEGGRIDRVEILSQAGGQCRLRNPWPEATVALHRNGARAETLAGALLTFPTAKGERLTLVPLQLAARRPTKVGTTYAPSGFQTRAERRFSNGSEWQ